MKRKAIKNKLYFALSLMKLKKRQTPLELGLLLDEDMFYYMTTLYGGKTIKIPHDKDLKKYYLLYMVLQKINNGYNLKKCISELKITEYNLRWLRNEVKFLKQVYTKNKKISSELGIVCLRRAFQVFGLLK